MKQQQAMQITPVMNTESQVVVIQGEINGANGDCVGPCLCSCCLSTLLSPFASFCLVCCFPKANQRGGILIGAVCSAFISAIIFFSLAGYYSSYFSQLCKSTTYRYSVVVTSNGQILTCTQYYNAYVVTPLNAVGGVFIGLGVIFLIIAVFAFRSGRVQYPPNMIGIVESPLLPTFNLGNRNAQGKVFNNSGNVPVVANTSQVVSPTAAPPYYESTPTSPSDAKAGKAPQLKYRKLSMESLAVELNIPQIFEMTENEVMKGTFNELKGRYQISSEDYMKIRNYRSGVNQ